MKSVVIYARGLPIRKLGFVLFSMVGDWPQKAQKAPSGYAGSLAAFAGNRRFKTANRKGFQF
jgi:hypothetical protein